jgi:hypothetical protein
MSQFFTNEISNSSVARIAGSMYKDGYDLRHMGSMGIPVFVKNTLINVYIKMNMKNSGTIMAIAEREKCELDFKLKEYKMKFIADSIGTAGNAIKFVSPPTIGNPCSINMVQYMSFIKNGIVMIEAEMRDSSVEEAMHERKMIDSRWRELHPDSE